MPDQQRRIAVVCLGNICRSPMADVVLKQRLHAAGSLIEVVSAGTGAYHEGDPMDRRAAAALRAAGYDPAMHRARQFDASWFDECDLILAMDEHNHAALLHFAAGGPHRGKVKMFRSFDPLGDGDVPDPFYGSPAGFEEVLAIIERTADVLVAELLQAAPH